MITLHWIVFCVLSFTVGAAVMTYYWDKKIKAMLRRFINNPDIFHNPDYVSSLRRMGV